MYVTGINIQGNFIGVYKNPTLSDIKNLRKEVNCDKQKTEVIRFVSIFNDKCTYIANGYYLTHDKILKLIDLYCLNWISSTEILCGNSKCFNERLLISRISSLNNMTFSLATNSSYSGTKKEFLKDKIKFLELLNKDWGFIDNHIVGTSKFITYYKNLAINRNSSEK